MTDCGSLKNVLIIVRTVITIIQWAVPIILILVGSIDLVKAVMAGKEDDIKKNQNTLFKRVIAAVIVFLIPIIVLTVTGLVGGDEWKDCWDAAKDGKIIDIVNIDDSTTTAASRR